MNEILTENWQFSATFSFLEIGFRDVKKTRIQYNHQKRKDESNGKKQRRI